MSDRRKLVPFFVPLMFGVISLSNSLGNPRITALHGSDIVQLIGSGMCFGAAIAVFVVFMRGRRTS